MDNFRQKSVLLIVGIVFFLGTGVAFGQTNETIIIDNLGAGVPKWDKHKEPTMADLITPSGDNGYITWTSTWHWDDPDDPLCIPYQTTWYESAGNGCYGPNYLYSDYHYKDTARYRFIPRIPAGGGTYEVWIHYTFGEYRSPKVPVVIRHADSGEFGNDVYYINMQNNDEHWVYVASVRFNEFEHDPENPTDDYGFVQLSGCNLRVCIDAVKLVPTSMVSPKARDDSAELGFSPLLPVIPHVQIPILVNDSAIHLDRPSPGPFPVKIVRQPEYGKVRLARCTTTSIRPSICAVYTLSTDVISDKEVFGDTFEYSVSNGKYSNTALVTVNFHGTDYSEVRAVWLNRHAFDNNDKRNKLIALLNMGNINTIYVVSPDFISPWNGVHYFGESYQVSFDALYERICQNDEADASFHIWIPNLYRPSFWEDGSIVWVEVNWEYPDESAAQVKWAEALINEYPEADGIHFDYIRERYSNNPLNHEAMANITKTVVQTKAMINNFNTDHPEYPHKHLTAATKDNWRDYPWGISQIPDWYVSWFDRNYGQAPGGWNYVKNYNDEVINYIPGFLNYAQDCSGWIIRDEIDSITDMSYSESIFYWQKRMLTHKSFANNWSEGCDEKFSRVCMGLEDNYEFHEPEMILQKINEGRLHGCKGFSIFQLTTKDDDCINKSQLLMELLTGPTGPYHKRADSWLQD